MNLEWKYKIDLKDDEVFEEIQKKYKIVINDEIKEFIIKYNAATPSKYKFMLKTDEKVFGAVLSFNKNEEGVDTIDNALEIVKNIKVLPFGIDPFGNYICYDAEKSEVVVWNHENNEIIGTEKNINEFLESLY